MPSIRYDIRLVSRHLLVLVCADMNRIHKQIKYTLPTVLLILLGLVLVGGVQYVRESALPGVDFSNHSRDTQGTLANTATDVNCLRFAVASMVSAEQTFSMYNRLVQRICRDIGRPDVFIQRPSYSQVRQSLEQGLVDVAFVCTGTYVHSLPNQSIKLLAEPVFMDGQTYRCLILVPSHSATQGLADLKNKVMAYTDRESNTGCLVPSHALSRQGQVSESFFSKLIFTGSHDRSINAVARGIVDAAAVDSLVWFSKLRTDPKLSDRIRIIWESDPFGPPPVVVPAGIDPDLEARLLQAFLALDKDDAGRDILSAIGIERFAQPQPEHYRSAISLYRELQAHEN